MKPTKIKSIVGVLIIGAMTICGCGRSDVHKQKTQLEQALAPTEWNNVSTRISPFTKVRYEGDAIMVTYNSTEYELATVDDLPVSVIVTFCQKQYGDKWKKRFAEDLVPVLNDMGHPINSDNTASLTLVDRQTGEQKIIEKAPFTEENRQKVHQSLNVNL